MDTDSFGNMIDKAEEDAKHGRIKDAKQLRNEIKSWK